MSTIGKAMELLGHFSPLRTEIGLSEFQRLIGRDKATVHRHLTALESAGLLEQDRRSRRYRIGPAVLRLAALREAALPRRAGTTAALAALSEATGETAHASILEGDRLATLAQHESAAHATRVVISEAVLPLHATASGLAVLAFGGADLRAAAERRLERFTAATPCDPAALAQAVEAARATGFGLSREGYEAGVHGMAVPIFDGGGTGAGAVAVASMASRMTPALERRIRTALVDAGRAITAAWGGIVPEELERVWARTADAPQDKGTGR
jgi:DNA-binding IclR family transcriptional regulator